MNYRTRLIRFTVLGYCLISLPVMFVFLNSEYVRYVAIQTVTNWRGKALGIPTAYIGDSITAGGRNWGSAFRSINLAGNGYTVLQIENQIGRAEVYSPKRIFILAGTNDILSRRPFDLKQFESDFQSLIFRAKNTKAEVYITLIPFTSREGYNNSIFVANEIIRKLAESSNIPVIDLNSTVAPNGKLLQQYTVDGVHLNGDAYRIWRSLIKNKIQSGTG